MICLVMRYTLKFLLMYKGFMNETRGKGPSLMTKIWGVLVKGKNCLDKAKQTVLKVFIF